MYTVVMVIFNIRFKTSGRKTYDRIESVFKKAYICQNALFNLTKPIMNIITTNFSQNKSNLNICRFLLDVRK